MLNIFYFILGLITDVAILIEVNSLGKDELTWALTIISLGVFAIWGSLLLSDLRSDVDKQLKDLHSLKEYYENKQHYKQQLEDYKIELKEELVTNYKNFEESIMGKITDSKLIATIMQESNYSNILKDYHCSIKNILINISKCDTDKTGAIRRMKARQDNILSGYGLFFPKRLKYEDPK